MNEKMILAYLAGAMDSDGFFGIKRSTYAMRVKKDAHQPVYSERAGLKQITQAIPNLLRETFGGGVHQEKASTVNGHPLWTWSSSNCIAAECASKLLPLLRVKMAQAALVIELRSTKADGRFKQLAYWFEQENPNWRSMPMLTVQEAGKRLGFSNPMNISQCITNGSLLALPRLRVGLASPRLPEPLVDLYATLAGLSKDNRARGRPAQLIAWRERLWDQMRHLNRIGTGNHPIFMRTGPYTLA